MDADTFCCSADTLASYGLSSLLFSLRFTLFDHRLLRRARCLLFVIHVPREMQLQPSAWIVAMKIIYPDTSKLQDPTLRRTANVQRGRTIDEAL